MQRAEKLFSIEERASSSRFVERIWRARSEPASAFISVAASHWEIVVWRCGGNTHATLRGPETHATAMPIPVDAEFVGVRFRLGAFMPAHPLAGLLDRGLPIASPGGERLHLGGEEWEMPGYDNMEVFVGKLAGAGLITADPLVGEALAGEASRLTRRSVERRVRKATGLTIGAIRQIERARAAAALLDAGVAIADVVIEAGYADQAHLTRSLRRLMGQTPGRMAQQGR